MASTGTAIPATCRRGSGWPWPWPWSSPPVPDLVLLDEPTRGLDYPGKDRLVAIVRHLTAEGACVVMATHDVELVAKVASRGVVLAEGEVVADGRARDVVCHSPVFAPQVAKILAPEPWLTVEEVVGALGEADHG